MKQKKKTKKVLKKHRRPRIKAAAHAIPHAFGNGFGFAMMIDITAGDGGEAPGLPPVLRNNHNFLT